MIPLAAVPTLLLAATLAQEPDPGARARELLSAADAACRAVVTASYRATHTVETPHGIPPPNPASGRVVLQKLEGPDPLGARVAIDGVLVDARGPGKDMGFAIAYDGEIVRAHVVDPVEEQERVQWTSKPGKGGGDLERLADRLILRKLVVEKPFAAQLEGPRLELGGSADVGGVPCDVVVLDYAKGDGAGRAGGRERVEWFLGKRDHLPRKVVTRFVRNGLEGSETLTLLGLESGVEVDPSRFVLAVPEGYQVLPWGSEAPGSEDGDPPDEGGLLPLGSKAPEWSLEDPSGKTHRLADYRGKVVVLDFWATWCPPCRRAMPGLQRLHERFASEAVAVLGISTSERGGDPAAFMKEKGYTYGLLLNGEKGPSADYRAEALPTLYVIGTDGKVLHAEVGYDPEGEERMARVIEEHLRKKGG